MQYLISGKRRTLLFALGSPGWERDGVLIRQLVMIDPRKVYLSVIRGDP